MNELREQRDYYRKLSDEAHKKWKAAKAIEMALREEFEEFNNLHEKYDRHLAELDGRKTIYPLNVKKTTVKKDIVLTRDQILGLASRLGLVLNLEEEESDGEELDFEN